jgi:lipid A 3-O-deacylase
MKCKHLVLICFLMSRTETSLSQAIDNMASFRMFPAREYLRINYDNDYFTATDYYYTQGINFESVNDAYSKFFLNKLLAKTKDGTTQYGFALEHNGYTPTEITSDIILQGDRPFAAAIMLKSFVMNDHQVGRYRLTSSLSLGIIGPAAGGYEMQKQIHQWIHATTPHGWQYQIANDLVLNYEVGFEKNVLRIRDIFVFNGLASGRVGTLSTKGSAGIVMMFGSMNSKIQQAFGGKGGPFVEEKKLRFHAYIQPLVNAIGYDATLQGGVFNHSSPYVISAGDVSRFTAQVNYGVVATFNAMYLEYYKSAITKEWETGTSHRWGGIRIGVKL